MDRLVPEPTAAGLVEGRIIAPAPASITDKVFVELPWQGDEPWGPLPWVTRGSLLPSVGDRCLVAFDSNRNAWVVCWDW